ncbi:hypothetical protein QJS66_16845 [Kocuria rhizophila]|nr:hypothetical protein QJS66_16845 [Kocuria rhizophila]
MIINIGSYFMADEHLAAFRRARPRDLPVPGHSPRPHPAGHGHRDARRCGLHTGSSSLLPAWIGSAVMLVIVTSRPAGRQQGHQHHLRGHPADFLAVIHRLRIRGHPAARGLRRPQRPRRPGGLPRSPRRLSAINYTCMAPDARRVHVPGDRRQHPEPPRDAGRGGLLGGAVRRRRCS